MTKLARILGPLALILTIVPPVLFMVGWFTDPMMKHLMVAGCVLWFVVAPRFMPGGDH